MNSMEQMQLHNTLNFMLILGIAFLMCMVCVALFSHVMLRRDWKRAAQAACNHPTNGVRVYSRPLRRMVRKQIWWVCPHCDYREREVQGKHA
jgi:RNase P subunit RPR2